MSFLTIDTTSTYEETIKKSRFICNLSPVQSEAEAKDFIEQITAENPKANHNCYAYLLGETDQVQRASDNGEPTGTAGVPILEVLKRNQLHNVVAVVTRYFGGVKLGAGGLIRAYSGTAAAGVEAADVVDLVELQLLQLTIEYPQLDSLNYFLSSNDVPTESIDYGSQVVVTIAVTNEQQTDVISQLTDLLSGKVTIAEGDTKLVAVPFERK